MLKSCKYCGRIHSSKYNCGKRPVYKKYNQQDGFRSTGAWQRKRAEIKERDLNLCRMSLLEGNLVYDDLQVHHIEPLNEAWEKRLDDDNLITLSSYYHELAEAGKISRELLHQLAASPPVLKTKKIKTLPHRQPPSEKG